MKFEKTPILEKRGWTVKKDEEGGFWVLGPSGEFGGYSPRQKDAEEMLMEKSGAIEETMPPVKADAVKVLPGNKIQNFGYWYRVDRFLLNGKPIGEVQVRNKGPKVITKVKDKACIGYDLKWMLRENGFRLED